MIARLEMEDSFSTRSCLLEQEMEDSFSTRSCLLEQEMEDSFSTRSCLLEQEMEDSFSTRSCLLEQRSKVKGCSNQCGTLLILSSMTLAGKTLACVYPAQTVYTSTVENGIASNLMVQ